MKAHTSGFKENLIELGRELRGVITYENTTLEEEIMAITPHYEADLLKSVMKQLDLELSVDIPLGTVINCQIGIMVNENYEMLNFGNYVVYNSEKQEDAGTYKITCYDKLLYSMKQNEDLGVTYPISIKNYLWAVANKIGLTLTNQTFYNEDLTIPSELYLGLDYTYRDILDEIAQATGSIIALNENDEIIVKYPTQTNDIIDEDFLKDVNVDFGQKYGVINSIVLSRAGESDNVYLRDEESVAENGLTEIKIVDNQIMNFNNRSDFLEGLLLALDGLYYYINDFDSTGILYYEVGDLYNISIGENTYQCIMLNDEINVTTGIEEIVHTDMPEQSETDYDKADKTDRRINQTYLIVDKQNQQIQSMINNVTTQNNKISQITQTVDEINTKIQDIADITTYGESQIAVVNLSDINESEPIMIKVKPIGESIKRLYPARNLHPSDSQYLTTRIINFKRTYTEEGVTKTEDIPYELPDDLLYYDSNYYDEFYLDYDSQTCQITKRCEFSSGINNIFYLDDYSTTNISNISVDQFENILVIPSSNTCTISQNKKYILDDNTSYAIQMNNLKNVSSATVYIDYYSADDTYLGYQAARPATEQRPYEYAEIRNTDYSNVAYCKLRFVFYYLTIGEEFSFNIMMNSGTNILPFETYYPSVTPKDQEQVIDYPYPAILLGDGNYKISIEGYDYGYLYVRLMASNIYTDQFATKAEVTTEINQTARDITIAVQENYYSKEETMSRAEINTTAQGITSTVLQKVGKDEIISSINQSAEAVTINAGKINLNGAVTANQNFKIKTDGSMEANNGTFTGGLITLEDNGNALDTTALAVKSDDFKSNYTSAGMTVMTKNNNILKAATYAEDNGFRFYLSGGGSIIDFKPDEVRFSGLTTFKVNCPITQGSLESLKKNIQKYDKSVLNIIKNNDIYQYNFKNEKDTDKKHFGFVIPNEGGDYKVPNEVVSQTVDGIDTYSMTSILWKAVQEQQEQIEQMKKEIEKLKGGK